MIRRPPGRYYEALDVTHCLAENRARRVIDNLIANIDERTGTFRKCDPDYVGDCIVETRMGNHTDWHVVIGETWIPAQGLQHALDVLAVARGVQRELREAA